MSPSRLLSTLIFGALVLGPSSPLEAAQARRRSQLPVAHIFGLPCFSPDGRFVAIVVGNPTGKNLPMAELRILSTNDWKAIDLKDQPTGLYKQGDLEWSPDGKRLLACFAFGSSYWDVERNTWARATARGLASHSLAKWSPVGPGILALRSTPFGRQFVQHEGDTVTPLAPANFRNVSAIEWAEDRGSVWVAVSGSYSDPTHNYEPGHPDDGIYEVKFSGEAPTRLASLGQVRRITRSPDGKHLACVVGGVDTTCFHYPSKLFLVDCADGKATEISKTKNYFPVSWCPDGSRLAYSTRDGTEIYSTETRTYLKCDPAREKAVYWAAFHPVTGKLWGVSGGTLVEFEAGKWVERYTIPECDARGRAPVQYE